MSDVRKHFAMHVFVLGWKKRHIVRGEVQMWGGTIFLIFFVLFTAASYAIPVPIFPGNIVQSLFTSVPAMYAPLISSVVNGIVYGCIVWLVSILVIRRYEEPKVTDAKLTG